MHDDNTSSVWQRVVKEVGLGALIFFLAMGVGCYASQDFNPVFWRSTISPIMSVAGGLITVIATMFTVSVGRNSHSFSTGLKGVYVGLALLGGWIGLLLGFTFLG